MNWIDLKKNNIAFDSWTLKVGKASGGADFLSSLL